MVGVRHPLAPLFSALDDRQQAIAQQVMTDEIAKHRAVSGSYRLPATARVITARC